jgi:hypothetical protein
LGGVTVLLTFSKKCLFKCHNISIKFTHSIWINRLE